MSIAVAISCPLQKTRALTTSTEFLKWCAFLDKKANERTADQWYLARIAMEIRAASQPRKKWKLSQFLLSFTRPKPKTKAPRTDKEKAEYLAQSKAYWDALVFHGKPSAPLTQQQILEKHQNQNQ